MLVEDVATGERQWVAADFPVRAGQHVVIDGRRRVVVALGQEPN
jgi:hypothetical protein